jgi:electron transport complex protein RnfC
MAAFIRKDNLKMAAEIGVMDCISCGSCSWVCPSHLPLVHYFNYAVGAINAQERERRKNDHIKELSEARQDRLEKIAAAKSAHLAAAAARKPPTVTGETTT